MFNRIKRFFSALVNDPGFQSQSQSQPKLQERPTGYDAPEVSMKALGQAGILPQNNCAAQSKQVNKVFAGNSAFLKSRNNRPNPKFSSKMGSALVQVMGHNFLDTFVEGQNGSYVILLTVTRKDGTVFEQMRNVGVDVYFEKIRHGFMSEITEQQYDVYRESMLNTKKLAGPMNRDVTDRQALNKFKADYETHRAQQPNNQNVGVVIKVEEGGVVSEKEFRGVDQIDAFIARAEKNEVRFLEMIR